MRKKLAHRSHRRLLQINKIFYFNSIILIKTKKYFFQELTNYEKALIDLLFAAASCAADE